MSAQTIARPASAAAAAAPTDAGAGGRQARDRDLAAAAPFLADWQDFERELAVPPEGTVAALRRAAIERFAVLGFPTVRQEEWRFTNLAPLARTSFRRPAPGAAPAVARASIEPWTFPAAALLVFIDGRWSRELSSAAAGELPEGTVVEGLAEAMERQPRLVERWLGRCARCEDQPFAALNTAFVHDGALVVVPRGAVVERPIHLLYVSSGSSGASGSPGAADEGEGDGGAAAAAVYFPRTLVVAEEASQLTVVETYVGVPMPAGAGIYFNCGVTELAAGPGAVIDHYKVQREGRDAFHLATFDLRAERGSNVSSHSISLGGALVRNDVRAWLGGEGIECILNGLYLADGRQLVDNHMRVEHAAPHCASHELYKGILDGHARSVFNGLIHVHPGAQKTDAKQSNRNLLLSADAIANSNPQLEIFADDVKCTHGSTVGQLDEDAVFYLRSRGIGAAAARSILTYAFAADIVERIKVERVRRDLEEFLFARLPQGEVVRQAV